jgi:regulator of RNase E activity RraA
MTDTALLSALRQITTATIATVLLKKGIRRAWMKGPKPLAEKQPRIAGRAFTLRFVPAREDLATPASWSSPRSTRAAIEEMPEGCIAIIDAMGETAAGVFGDILAQRMAVRGVAGLVTDGVMRDKAGVLETGLPVWCAGVAAPASVAGLTFVGWQEPIGCGGVAIYPGDVVVADGDGAIVIPAALAEEVARLGAEQERLEAWIMDEVKQGKALPGLYPPNEEALARYAASKKS